MNVFSPPLPPSLPPSFPLSPTSPVKVMSRQKVLRSLLSFVIQNDKAGNEWSPAQFEELQLLVS